jgi:hypothetical protein
VPALALSFEWYSKDWWPPAKIEEFTRNYGKLSPADTARLLEECLAAVEGGLKLARKVAKQIPEFAGLAGALVELWKRRIATFRAG